MHTQTSKKVNKTPKKQSGNHYETIENIYPTNFGLEIQIYSEE